MLPLTSTNTKVYLVSVFSLRIYYENMFLIETETMAAVGTYSKVQIKTQH